MEILVVLREDVPHRRLDAVNPSLEGDAVSRCRLRSLQARDGGDRASPARSRRGRSWSVLTRQRSVPQISARESFVEWASVGAARRAAVAARAATRRTRTMRLPTFGRMRRAYAARLRPRTRSLGAAAPDLSMVTGMWAASRTVRRTRRSTHGAPR